MMIFIPKDIEKLILDFYESMYIGCISARLEKFFPKESFEDIIRVRIRQNFVGEYQTIYNDLVNFRNPKKDEGFARLTKELVPKHIVTCDNDYFTLSINYSNNVKLRLRCYFTSNDYTVICVIKGLESNTTLNIISSKSVNIPKKELYNIICEDLDIS